MTDQWLPCRQLPYPLRKSSVLLSGFLTVADRKPRGWCDSLLPRGGGGPQKGWPQWTPVLIHRLFPPAIKIHFCGLHLSEWTQGFWTQGPLETSPPFWVNMGPSALFMDYWWLEGSWRPHVHVILQISWFPLNRRTNTTVFWKPETFFLVYRKRSSSTALKGSCDSFSAHRCPVAAVWGDWLCEAQLQRVSDFLQSFQKRGV